MAKIFLLLPALVIFGGFPAALPAAALALDLMSPAFQDGGNIPAHHARPAAGGRNLSIPLKWTGAPEATKSFALSIVDIHPVANNWVHWLVINIAPNTTSLPEGASGKNIAPGATELKNSFGAMGYGGPQPPRGTGPHPYVITIYALSADKIDLRPDATLAEFQKAIKGKVLKEASIRGNYAQ